MNLQQIFDNTDSVSQWAKSKMLIYMQTGKN